MMRYTFLFILAIFLYSCQSIKSGVDEGTKESISFKLINSSNESIPLLIPSVMNPNLSPNSESGVTLKIGQNIYFRNSGKKYLLISVDKSIKEGEKIDVPQLLLERKKDLGIS